MALSERWWQALSDEKLNAHIETALTRNFSLEAAWERLQAARAISNSSEAELYPELDLRFSASRVGGDTNSRSTEYTLGPAASYEVDLWGRIGAAADASALQALASEAAYRSAALSLSGDVALTWVRFTEAHQQLQLLNKQTETNEKALKVLKARFGIGQIRSEDILRQQLLIEAIQEEVLNVETEIHTLSHQLAVLRGEAPQARQFMPTEQPPRLPALPDTGLPSELIQRRPDIQARLLEMEAADKQLASAVRAQYPSLSLSASYVSEANTAGNLFSDWVSRLAGELIAPVFDAGQRRAEVQRQEALREERLNQYAQAVLDAFREVEDALIRELKQQKRIANLETRLQLAREAYEQIQLGYFNGAGEFLSMLEAQTSLQALERDLLRAQRVLLEVRIALYRALSGGFQTAREQTFKDIEG